MKIEHHALPCEDRPVTVLIRFTPEKESERRQLDKIQKALKGTSAVATSPKIGKETGLSLMFHYAKEKKNQEKNS